MSYDDDDPRNDYTLCDDLGCASCARERVRRAERDAQRAPGPSADGTIYVPPVVTEDVLLSAIGTGDGTVTLTRDDASRVVRTLAGQARDASSRETNAREAYSRARAAHAADIETIGGVLLEKAEEHGWCSEYERCVEELNASLTFPLPVRNRHITVYLSTDDDGTLYTLEVEVDGDSDDADAARLVVDAVRGSSWLTDWNYG